MTVDRPAAPAAGTAERDQPSQPRAQAQAASAPVTPTYVQCDSNIQAKRGTTTCEFAQNAFWHYWTEGEASSLAVYSPATGSTFDTSCDVNAANVVCTTDDGGAVRFPLAAIDRYSQSQADAYASSHDLGPDPYEEPPAAPAPAYDPPDDYDPSLDDYDPSYGENIPYYDEGNGYRVQCADGMYSQSGGIQGACSGHGGVR